MKLIIKLLFYKYFKESDKKNIFFIILLIIKKSQKIYKPNLKIPKFLS